MPKVINNRIATAASEIPSDACHILRRRDEEPNEWSNDREDSQSINQGVTRSPAADVKEMDEQR